MRVKCSHQQQCRDQAYLCWLVHQPWSLVRSVVSHLHLWLRCWLLHIRFLKQQRVGRDVKNGKIGFNFKGHWNPGEVFTIIVVFISVWICEDTSSNDNPFNPEGRMNRTAASLGVKSLYEYVEIFGGVGEISQNDGCCFEYRRDRTHNIHIQLGMETLAKALCCTALTAVVVLEPTCSSFLSFGSVSTSKRTMDFWQWFEFSSSFPAAIFLDWRD